MDRFEKDPDAHLDYYVDWTAFLGGDTISLAEVVTDSADITVTSNEVIEAGTKHVIWVEGGVVGQAYVVTSRIDTALGREDDRSFLLIIKEK